LIKINIIQGIRISLIWINANNLTAITQTLRFEILLTGIRKKDSSGAAILQTQLFFFAIKQILSLQFTICSMYNWIGFSQPVFCMILTHEHWEHDKKN